MRFSRPGSTASGVLIDVYRTRDGHMIETAAYTGADYEDRTFISVTNQIGCPVRCDFCR